MAKEIDDTRNFKAMELKFRSDSDLEVSVACEVDGDNFVIDLFLVYKDEWIETIKARIKEEDDLLLAVPLSREQAYLLGKHLVAVSKIEL